MILGMLLATFTAVHVVISLIGIAAGVIVVVGMLCASRLPGWTALSRHHAVDKRDGFFFPAAQVLPFHVGVVQAFRRVPALGRLAPTQSEPPFLVAQVLVKGIFVVLGILAVRRFCPVLMPRPV
jgi:hypothetical protein